MIGESHSYDAISGRNSTTCERLGLLVLSTWQWVIETREKEENKETSFFKKSQTLIILSHLLDFIEVYRCCCFFFFSSLTHCKGHPVYDFKWMFKLRMWMCRCKYLLTLPILRFFLLLCWPIFTETKVNYFKGFFY